MTDYFLPDCLSNDVLDVPGANGGHCAVLLRAGPFGSTLVEQRGDAPISAEAVARALRASEYARTMTALGSMLARMGGRAPRLQV